MCLYVETINFNPATTGPIEHYISTTSPPLKQTQYMHKAELRGQVDKIWSVLEWWIAQSFVLYRAVYFFVVLRQWERATNNRKQESQFDWGNNEEPHFYDKKRSWTLNFV